MRRFLLASAALACLPMAAQARDARWFVPSAATKISFNVPALDLHWDQPRPAQFSMMVQGAASSYTGPIDAAAATPVAAYCLRACSAARAASLFHAVNIRNGVSNATTNIDVLATGALDTATAISWLGTDASGQATSSGTAVALTNLTAAVHAGDTIGVGAGFNVGNGTYCVSVGTATGVAPNIIQTCTTNTSQTISVAEPVALQPGAFVPTLYDQGPNGYDAVQAIPAGQPQLMLFGGGSSGTLPYLLFPVTGVILTTASITTQAQPFTLSSIWNRTGSFNVYQAPVATTTGSVYIGNGDTANQFYIYGGTSTGLTGFTDGAWHTVQGFFNGASGAAYIDGTSHGVSVGTASLSSTLSIGLNVVGNSEEWLFFAGSVNTSAVHTNQVSYWSVP